MGLFTRELYRSFFVGFGITALVMALNLAPQLVGA